MDESQMEVQRKIKHRIIYKPIIVGTHAVYLGKKAPEDKNNKWCCYVRGLNGEDISKYITKVEFELDKSFPQPNITISKPPFQIQEAGWGQFTINVKLYFPDPACKPVWIAKELILFDDLPRKEKRPIIAEDYNELVFVEPSPLMFKLLSQQDELPRTMPQPLPSAQSAGDVEMKDPNEQSQPGDVQQETSVDVATSMLADKKNKSDNIFKAID